MGKRITTWSMVFGMILSAATVAAFDIDQGFLGTRWKAKVSELTGFSKITEKGQIAYYRNLNKAYSLDEVRITNVIYGFFENRFFAVYIQIESPDAYAKIRNYLLNKYGDPKETLTMRNEQTIYTWKYQTTKIKLKSYQKTGSMKLAFYYMPLAQKVNESQQEDYLDTTREFFPIEKDKVPEYIPFLRF